VRIADRHHELSDTQPLRIAELSSDQIVCRDSQDG
jgi:hypothetical protein